jgi:hypothetical protein
MAINYNNLTPAYDYNKQSTDMQAISQIAGGGMQSGAIPGQQIKARGRDIYRPQQPYKQLPGTPQPNYRMLQR